MIWAFAVLVVIGLVLLGFEIFVPGGLLGLIGFIALASAIVIAFTSINTTAGVLSLIGTFVVAMVYMYLWVVVFPRTRLGKKFELSDSVEGKGTGDYDDLIEQLGEAVTDLRPAGIARIGGQRVDVVARTGYIDAGTAVQVVDVEGNRVTVTGRAS